jgi:hypothetical protein
MNFNNIGYLTFKKGLFYYNNKRNFRDLKKKSLWDNTVGFNFNSSSNNIINEIYYLRKNNKSENEFDNRFINYSKNRLNKCYFQKISTYKFPKIKHNSVDNKINYERNKPIEQSLVNKRRNKFDKINIKNITKESSTSSLEDLNLGINNQFKKTIKSNSSIHFLQNDVNKAYKNLTERKSNIRKENSKIKEIFKDNNEIKNSIKQTKDKIIEQKGIEKENSNDKNSFLKETLKIIKSNSFKNCLNHSESFNQIFSRPKDYGKKIEIISKKNHKIFSSNNQEKYKSSSQFYSSKSSPNIKNLINKVIEENKKANIFRDTSYFNNFGKDYVEHLKTKRKNYYINKENSKDFFNDNNNKNKENNKTLNCLKLIIISPFEWKKHEEIWSNLNLLTISPELEKNLLPPNDNDVIISSYLILYPKILNFCSINNILNNRKKERDYISFNIDDNIINPKKEMKKWKMAYKRVIFRWHPDKLNPILNEVKLRDENIKNNLIKKSTVIINNMNNLFKNINEILVKIMKNKK